LNVSPFFSSDAVMLFVFDRSKIRRVSEFPIFFISFF
jgi:hypothetical protein